MLALHWLSPRGRPNDDRLTFRAMAAPASKLVLRVDPATARAYRDASDEDKERARSAFALTLRARAESVEETLAFFDEVAREAQARGLTPEVLDDILNDRPPSPEEMAAPGAAPTEDADGAG